MSYLIYGKRTQEVIGGGPDSRFAALTWDGIRVAKKTDAFEYATKEDAQERLNKIKGKAGVVFEIRKA